jgi:Predicted 3'-5' exonuclease related to the exonuclease domain of PolB
MRIIPWSNLPQTSNNIIQKGAGRMGVNPGDRIFSLLSEPTPDAAGAQGVPGFSAQGTPRRSPQGKATLHEISRAMGLPGKPKGIDGAEVERYFHEGKVKEIADYCEGDVVNTYQVWLRYELFGGTLSQDAFEKSQWNLEDFMNVRGNTKKLPGIM